MEWWKIVLIVIDIAAIVGLLVLFKDFRRFLKRVEDKTVSSQTEILVKKYLRWLCILTILISAIGVAFIILNSILK